MTKIQPLCQPQWTRRLLIVAMSAAVSSQALALEAITDEELSVTTGEGIAFLPENVSLRMNGADTNNSGAGTFDTGYIRIIPVGPLTTAAAASGAGKGDIFLYGLAISQSDKAYGAGRASADWNSRFSRTIDSWGMPENPWVLKVETVTGVPDFAAPDPTATTNGSVSYLGLEAPLYRTGNIVALSDAEKSAYNLKLAFWADAFVRDPSVVEGQPGEFDLGGPDRANRLRLQAIWDGFSINGSDVKIFQTLGGAKTGVQGMSSSYNNTLGIAGKLRFNSGDSSSLRAAFSPTAVTRTTSTNNRYTTTDLVRPGPAATVNASRQYRLRSVDTVETITGGDWTVPDLSSVLRFSTRECGVDNLNCATPAAQGLLSTPAINGGNAPTFDATEGLFIYNLNLNLVLGSLYQPLTVGVDPDGKNIVLELARIPNKESIYKKIYTDYSGLDATYLGSTCNVHQCGTPRTLGGVTYQGNTATHSSISIGSTEYNAATNTLTAHKGNGAVGISFGALQNIAAVNTTNRYYQLEQQFRQRLTDNRWEYQNADGTFSNGTNFCTANTACYQFGQFGQWRPIASFNQATLAPLYNPTIAHPAQNVTGQTNAANNFAVPAWGPLAGASYSGTTWTSNAPPPAPASTLSNSSNNLGSAVIDGLLIQHLKFSTKGL